MDKALLEEELCQLPLSDYFFFDTAELEFSSRVRWVCEHECPMYGKTWACPPGVGPVEACQERCRAYPQGLLIATVTEVADVGDLPETLATRHDHEEITNQVRALMRRQGVEPYILSTEACGLCGECTYAQGQPCRFPERMHPCVESHGIVVTGLAERHGIPFQFGGNVVTWFSLLLFGTVDNGGNFGYNS